MTIKKAILLISCLATFYLMQTVSAEEQYKDKQIEELSGKYFYYSNEDGKASLTLTKAPASRPIGETDSCENTLAKLTSESAALPIPGTSLILAFLDCPINRDLCHDSVVAFFDRNNLNVPLCFSQLDLMPSGSYYYGLIGSLEARRARNGAFYVVVTLGGADGGDSWRSFLFLHIDKNCRITLLSKFYGVYGINYDKNNPGRVIAYRFVDDKTVEVTTDDLINQLDEKTGQFIEETLKSTSERFNLEDLYNNPQSRVFPSEGEKSLALLKSGADPNSREENGKTLFMSIVEELWPPLVKAGLNKGADVNAKSKDGFTVLMSAAKGADPEVLTILLDDGSDVNAKDDMGRTALMIAAGNNYSRKAVKVLLDYGADVNTKDDNGRTALLTATETGERQSIELLLDKGADINAGTKHGLTALMAAVNKAFWGKDSIVEFLIKRGADVNAKDDEGKTVLMYAAGAKTENAGSVKLLIEKGVDVNSRSNNGDTALEIAKKARQTGIVELLKAHGAKE
jgi:uncharacterized protein